MELQVTEVENAMYISCRNKIKRHAGGNLTEIGRCRSYLCIVNCCFSAYSGKQKPNSSYYCCSLASLVFLFPLSALCSHQGTLRGSRTVRSRIQVKFGEGQVPWRGVGDTLWQQFHSRALCAVQFSNSPSAARQKHVGHRNVGEKRSLLNLDLPAD